MLETFARQAALVLDRIELRAVAEQTRLLAESERLSRVLLNSISHELRTPLAAITTAATALADAEHAPAEHRRALLVEMQKRTRVLTASLETCWMWRVWNREKSLPGSIVMMPAIWCRPPFASYSVSCRSIR